MEHRWNPRKRTHCPVMIYQEPVGVVRAAVVNYSTTGLLVDVGPNAAAKGVIVGLVDATQFRFSTELFRLKALIIHRCEGLTGLMFIDRGHQATDLWRDLLQSFNAGTSYPRKERPRGRESGPFQGAAAYAME